MVGIYKNPTSTLTHGDKSPPLLDSSGRTVISTGTGSDMMQVGSPVDVITVTPTVLNADAYDAGDTVFDATVVTGAVRVSGGSALLQSIVVADKDDQKAQLRLVFFDSTVTFGTADSAPSLSDADSLKCVGSVEILAADYIDFGGVSVATKTAIGLLCKASGSANLYVAAMTSGTPTYTTGGLQLRLGFLQA